MRARLLAAAAVCGTGLVGASTEGIEEAWLFGNVERYAYYFADLLIGSPEPQRASVIVDTGSHLVGFPCKGCEHCGEHLDPAFDVNRSESSRWLACGSGCGQCGPEGRRCGYRETYSEGSSISGFWFKDVVELGDALNKNPPVRARLGCHTNENRLFYTQRANGIMGLAPSATSFGSGSVAPSILQDLFSDREHVDAAVFSLCLGTWGGKLTVGGYDSSHHLEALPEAKRHCSRGRPCEGDGTEWIRMGTGEYYFVFPQGLKVGDIIVASGGPSFGTTIIDSGTTYTYFPRPVYDSLLLELKTYCQLHNGCGAEIVDSSKEPSVGAGEGSLCWRLGRPELGPAEFPELRLMFENGKEVGWPPEGYLHERGNMSVWCQSFLHNNILEQTVLGISWMLHKDVIFDLSRGRLGVAQAKCPEHRRQPEAVGKEASELFSAARAPFVRSGSGLAGSRTSFKPAALACLGVPLLLSLAMLARAVGAAARAGWGRPRRALPEQEEESLLHR